MEANLGGFVDVNVNATTEQAKKKLIKEHLGRI
jgi:hypothetical protein